MRIAQRAGARDEPSQAVVYFMGDNLTSATENLRAYVERYAVRVHSMVANAEGTIITVVLEEEPVPSRRQL